jgi:hypothetical protein
MTVATGGQIMEADPVTDRNVRDLLADLLHDPGYLVSRRDG